MQDQQLPRSGDGPLTVTNRFKEGLLPTLRIIEAHRHITWVSQNRPTSHIANINQLDHSSGSMREECVDKQEFHTIFANSVAVPSGYVTYK